MPNITFTYESEHTFQLNLSIPKAVPAFNASGRLYVIFNQGTAYIGTSSNIKARFKERLRAIRELGFSQNELDDIRAYAVQIQIDGVNTPPNDAGYSGTIDVEGLLILTYITQLGYSVRNIEKWQLFVNSTGARINWNLVLGHGINVPHLHGKHTIFYLNNNYQLNV
ncbi:hypothetical protein ACN079_01155 [Pseudomonas sp. ABY48]|uniref:hypothetical protein n=1 Tax=Pseudomonas sp. ABY48 TaxID=3402865 RepID=UPI003B42BD8E